MGTQVTEQQRDAYYQWISPYLDASELELVSMRRLAEKSRIAQPPEDTSQETSNSGRHLAILWSGSLRSLQSLLARLLLAARVIR